jgi:hypothetical protein
MSTVVRSIPQVHNRSSEPELIIPRRISFLDGMSFLTGTLSAYYLLMIGQVYLEELVLPVVLLLLIRKRNAWFRPRIVRTILFLGLLWLVSLILTDIYRSTPQSDALRGCALVIVFLLDFIGLYLLIFPNAWRIVLHGIGLSIGLLLQTILQPSPYFLAEPWKFGYGYPLILLVLTIGAISTRNRSPGPTWGIFALALFGMYLVYSGTRAVGGIAVITALIVWFRSTQVGRGFAARLNVFNMLGLALIFCGLLFGVLQGYAYAANHGYLGEAAKLKYNMQSGGGTLGIILAARTEFVPSLYAIRDSPLLGHGSWARDPQAQYRRYLAYLVDWEYLNISQDRLSYLIYSSDLLPTHSHILQAWVWAGLAGMVFWLVVLILVVRALMAIFRQPNFFFPLALFLGLLAVWDILFSPLGAIMRAKWGFALNVFLYCLFNQQSKSSSTLGPLSHEGLDCYNFL